MDLSIEPVIPVITLGCSIYAGLLTRAHNRLSMVPHLE